MHGRPGSETRVELSPFTVKRFLLKSLLRYRLYDHLLKDGALDDSTHSIIFSHSPLIRLTAVFNIRLKMTLKTQIHEFVST